jgi:hypothetical protein
MKKLILGSKYAVQDILVCFKEERPNDRHYTPRPMMEKLEPFVLLEIGSSNFLGSSRRWYKILRFANTDMPVCWIYTFEDSLLCA